MIYPLNRKIKTVWEWIKKLQGEYLVKKQEIDNLEKRIRNIKIPEVIPSPIPPIEKYGYILIHAHNPEGKEIGSITMPGGIGHGTSVEQTTPVIYIDGIYNRLSPMEIGGHITAFPISIGSHVISVKFNDMVMEESINLNEGETKIITFIFSRTNFDKSPIDSVISVIGNLNYSWSGQIPPSSYEDVRDDEKMLSIGSQTTFSPAPPYVDDFIYSLFSTDSVIDVLFNSDNLIISSSVNAIWSICSWYVTCMSFAKFYALQDKNIILNFSGYSFNYWFAQSNPDAEYPYIYCNKIGTPSGIHLVDWEVGYHVILISTDSEFDRIQVGSYIFPYGVSTGGGGITGGNYHSEYNISAKSNLKISSVPYDLLGTAI